jgi:hypothetical protein
VSTSAPVLTSRFWRSRRSAAIAGIVFAVLLLVALTMMRIALSEGSFQALQTDAQRQSLIRLSLHLVPFVGIAFLWFIGVVRDQLGNVEDRLFSTVFLGSGLLFLAMLSIGAVTSTSLLTMLAGSDPNTELFAYGRSTNPDPDLGLCHANGGGVHALGKHGRITHFGHAAMGCLPRLSGRADSAGGSRGA